VTPITRMTSLTALQKIGQTFLHTDKIPRTWENATAEEVVSVMQKMAEKQIMLSVLLFDEKEQVRLFDKSFRPVFVFFKLSGARVRETPREFEIAGDFVVFVHDPNSHDKLDNYVPSVNGRHLEPAPKEREWIIWNMDGLYPFLKYHGFWRGQILPLVAMSSNICDARRVENKFSQ